MNWIQCFLFWGFMAVVVAVTITVGIWVDVKGNNNQSNGEDSNQWAPNLLGNPSFEFISVVGNLAVHWVPEFYGYSLLSETGNDTYHLYASTDKIIDPVVPYSDGVCLRLGSTAQPLGEERHYRASQKTLIDDYPEFASFSEVKVAAWCNPLYIGKLTSTHFYVSLSPIFLSNSSMAWETRLFFSFGYPTWEYEEKIIDFTETDANDVIGFSLSVNLVTSEGALLYCDDLLLTCK